MSNEKTTEEHKKMIDMLLRSMAENEIGFKRLNDKLVEDYDKTYENKLLRICVHQELDLMIPDYPFKCELTTHGYCSLGFEHLRFFKDDDKLRMLSSYCPAFKINPECLNQLMDLAIYEKHEWIMIETDNKYYVIKVGCGHEFIQEIKRKKTEQE